MSDLIAFTTARQQSRAELHAGWLDGGSIVIYTSPIPEPDDAITTQTILATFTLPDPIGTVTDGVITADAIETALIMASGTAAFGRAYTSTNVAIADYAVGGVGSGAAIQLDNLNLVEGAYAAVVSLVIAEG